MFEDNDEDERIRNATGKAGLGAALGGTALTGIASLLGGEKSLRRLLMKSAIGGAGLGGAAAGATYVGSKALGAPEEGEPGGYSHRAGLGGLLAGGATGAGLGYLAGSGGLGKLGKLASKIPGAAKFMEHTPVPGAFNNAVTDRLKKLAMEPSHGSGLKGAGLLGSILGGAGGLHGYFEGADIDALQNEQDEAKKRRIREALLGAAG